MPLPAIDTLKDVTATIFLPGTGDTGVIESSWGSGVTLNFDEISVEDTGEFVDHSGGQDETPWMRTRKGGFKCEIKMKLFGPLTGLARGKQVKLVLAAGATFSSAGDTVIGIITRVPRNYAIPSTISITIEPYGTALTRV